MRNMRARVASRGLPNMRHMRARVASRGLPNMRHMRARVASRGLPNMRNMRSRGASRGVPMRLRSKRVMVARVDLERRYVCLNPLRCEIPYLVLFVPDYTTANRPCLLQRHHQSRSIEVVARS
jgi:hypothetical protein